MDEQAKLRLHIELFEAEDNLAKMEIARRECIEVWNRDVREAKKIIERKRNELRSGCIQPELLDAVTGGGEKLLASPAGAHRIHPGIPDKT